LFRAGGKHKNKNFGKHQRREKDKALKEYLAKPSTETVKEIREFMANDDQKEIQQTRKRKAKQKSKETK
jgi:hypothetical protein